MINKYKIPTARDLATGHSINQAAYLEMADGEIYTFDLLTLHLWLKRFPVCPLSFKKADTQNIKLLNNNLKTLNKNPHASGHIMEIYSNITGYHFNSYQDFCITISKDYAAKKSIACTSQAALREIPTLLLLILFTALALHSQLFLPIYGAILLIMVSFITVRRVLIWLDAENFSTENGLKPANGWLNKHSKALVFLWQSNRANSDEFGVKYPSLPNHLDYRIRTALQSMRTMVADVYLTMLDGRYLGEFHPPITQAKNLIPPSGIKNSLLYLKKLHVPECSVPPLHSDHLPSASGISNAVETQAREVQQTHRPAAGASSSSLPR